MSDVVLLRSLLRAGVEPSYDTAHARIPDDLVDAHRRAGIDDWTIWRSGRELFHIVRCDDIEAAFRILEGEPANARWQRVIGDYVKWFDPAPLRLVWSMSGQTGA